MESNKLNKIIVCKNISLIVNSRYIQMARVDELFVACRENGSGLCVHKDLKVESWSTLVNLKSWFNVLSQSNMVFYYG